MTDFNDPCETSYETPFKHSWNAPESALRILQWNTDGLSPKVHELRQRLQLEKNRYLPYPKNEVVHPDTTIVTAVGDDP